MTPDQLIDEGRKLQRPCVLLRTEPRGPVAAVWYDRNDADADVTGLRCWISVDASLIPGVPGNGSGCVSVLVDDMDSTAGRVEVTATWPKLPGTKLYAYSASILPPIDAVFACGSEAVGDWIRANGWTRADRYNDNFRDAAIVREYERAWMREFPLFGTADAYAAIGGWHCPGADADWHELIPEQLMLLTFRDAEPWVEAWRMRDGSFRVIQRIT